MASIVDCLNAISTTIEDILNFTANDEALSKDFEQYLELNKIEVEGERDFNNILLQYVLDMKMQSGLRVLEYYRRNNDFNDEVLSALQNSFCSVFQVNKILSNAYEAQCLTSGVTLTLIPMVKMTHLKQIGRYDYIQARIIELNNESYILEIYDVISEFDKAKASIQAVSYLIQNPKSAYYKSEEKKQELTKSADEFYKKFKSCFNSDYIVTTNKKADDLIQFLNEYKIGEKKDYSSLIEQVEENKFFKVEEYNCDDKTFLASASGGFSSHKEIYDVGLWVDKKRGLYIIPFLETFFKVFKDNIEGKKECIQEFLTSDKVPPSVLKYAHDNNANFFEVINTALRTNFSTFEEILFNTKTAFLDDGVFSPVLILYNSKIFSNLIGFQEEETKENTTAEKIGRNDPCPCNSGLKYKNCCGKT